MDASLRGLLNGSTLTLTRSGIVVAALALLVAGFIYAYKKSDTFRKIVDAAWAGIKKAAQVVVNWFRVTAWPWMKKVIGWLGDAFKFLWKNVIKPAWNGISAIIKTEWKVISKVFGWIKTGVGYVSKAFSKAKDAIGSAWSKVKDKITSPLTSALRWVSDHFIAPINKLLGKVGLGFRLPTFGRAPVSGPPAGGYQTRGVPRLASGGHVPGFSPHDRADNIPAMLTAGEYVLPVRAVNALRSKMGGGFLEQLRNGLPGYADGGFVGKLWGGVKAVGRFIADPVGSIKGLASRLLSGLQGNVFVKIAKAALGKVAGGLGDKVAGMFSSSGSVGGSGVKRWSPLVLRALGLVGQPASLLNTVLRRMNQESGGNPNAINRWDINAKNGVPSQGLMQVIPPTFAAYRMPGLSGNIRDPLANIVASMRYALSRYGSLSAAYNRSGGYASGGLVKPTLYDQGGVLADWPVVGGE